MKKIPKQAYTTEFKELAVKRVADGQAIALAAKELGLSDQTLRNWIKASAAVVTDALTMAWFRRRPAPGVMHHSERGSQYASHAFQDKLKELGMLCSMSRKGNRRDNAPIESWFNSFKNERSHGLRYACGDEGCQRRIHRSFL